MLTNVAKRPMRAFFIAASGALCSLIMVFSFSLGARVTEHAKSDTIAKWTGHLWISAASDFKFQEDRIADYRREASAVRGYLESKAASATAVPWSETYSEMQALSSREHVGIQAVDFERDLPFDKATELASGALPGSGDQYACVIPSAIADKYRLKVGDSVTLFVPSVFGARNAMDFTVAGICRASAPWYDSTVCVRAADYLEMTELDGISPFYKIYVKDEALIRGMVKDLASLAPDFVVKGYRDDDFVRFILSLGTSDVALFGFMAMIIFLALLIGINSIMMTNIFDRRDEIGTLRALGFSSGTVRNLFFGEALVSLSAGYALGVAGVAAVSAWFESRIVAPPLLMLQYMFGMTSMHLSLTPLAALAPLGLLFALLFALSYRRIGIEAEKQAVSQMANR